jgi:hypothetical protein
VEKLKDFSLLFRKKSYKKGMSYGIFFFLLCKGKEKQILIGKQIDPHG